MAKDDTEEKNLPPSRRKLQKAREKGQVARSRDLTGAVALAGVVGFLMLGTEGLLTRAATLFDATADAATLPLGPALDRIGPLVGETWAAAVLPAAGLAVLLVVAASLVALGGIPFSLDPVTPRAEHVNPAEGFKRLFKLRSLIELLKSLVKVILLGAVLVTVLWSGRDALLLAPACGLGCVQAAFGHLAAWTFGASALAFVLVGGADVGLQRWLFRRDQRMSVSEQRRERRDTEGDPQIRGARRRLTREAVGGPSRLGLSQAVLLLHDRERSVAVGLRYRRGETPVPVVVCRGRGARAAALIEEAAARRVAVAEDSELAAAIDRRAVPGNPIPEDRYGAVAALLAQHGLV